jgi:hypothetical protein
MAQMVSHWCLTVGPGFTSESVHVRSVMDKMAMGQVFLRILWLSHQYHSTVALHSHISSGEWKLAHW